MLLKIGSKGEDVKTLQKKLGIIADGIFGKTTKKVVVDFQKSNKLKPDGIVGDKTWNLINKLVSSSVKPSAPSVPAQQSTSSDTNGFLRIVGLIIDNLEGGYFHPAMLLDGRLKTSKPELYSTSGETMFGLDRSAGHSLFYSTPRPKNNVAQDIKLIESNVYKYKNEASAEFWGTMDNAGAKNNWKWGYKGGDLNSKLKQLAAEIMKPYCGSLANQYLGKNKSIVESDIRLAFHFTYACWNGAGWFKKFASDLNQAIASGKTNLDDLANVALNSRMKEGLKAESKPNELIKQGGEKMAQLFPKLKNGTI